jgi:hypothetical protein
LVAFKSYSVACKIKFHNYHIFNYIITFLLKHGKCFGYLLCVYHTFIYFFIHEIFLFLILFWSYVVKIFVQLYFVIDSTKSISFYGWLLNPMGIHLLWYAHGGERTASHVAVHDVFVSIAKDARFYVFWKQTTFFRHLFFRLFVGGWHCSIGWWHLHMVDVVIINPIRIDLVSWVILFCKVPMITAIQMKEGLYCNCYIMDMFFLLP